MHVSDAIDDEAASLGGPFEFDTRPRASFAQHGVAESDRSVGAVRATQKGAKAHVQLQCGEAAGDLDWRRRGKPFPSIGLGCLDGICLSLGVGYAPDVEWNRDAGEESAVPTAFTRSATTRGNPSLDRVATRSASVGE